MKVLVLNACVRGEVSRTWKLAQACMEGLKEAAGENLEFEELNLMNMDLKYLSGDFFQEREELLQAGNRSHPRFDLAHQFASADAMIIAAPFWDLSIPAVLKVYIENISVDGITFGCNETGMYGLCKAKKMLFLTTRGAFYGEDGPLEHGARYLKALCEMYGIHEFECVYVDGTDVLTDQLDELMEEGCRKAKEAGAALAG